MEKDKSTFEEQWSQAFDGAEKSPPESVWAGIDGVLVNQEATGYKKRVIFFKWVAAASVFVALLAGVALWKQSVVLDQVAERSAIDTGQQAAQQDGADLLEQAPVTAEKTEVGEAASLASADVSGYPRGEDQPVKTKEALQANASGELVSASAEAEVRTAKVLLAEQQHEVVIQKEVERVPQGYAAWGEAVSLDRVAAKSRIEQVMDTPVAVDHLYLVPDLMAGKAKRKTEKPMDLWAGISLASGSFNPGTGEMDTNTPALAAADVGSEFSELMPANKTVPLRSEYVSGGSFSAGMDMGARVFGKMLLSSGLHYSAVSPGSSSNIIVTDVASKESFALSNITTEDASLNSRLMSGDLAVSQGVTNFDNTLQYLTIPLKAGYVVVDKRVNVVVNSGVSTNILIGSNLYQSEDGVQNFDGAPQADQLFNSTYFDLLTSVELGYRLQDKYYLSLEPNYRKALNDFTRQGSSLQGKPTHFGVSLGIKYNF